jgi:photosystem II stability/assembly factor-like uncharacterized protein
MREPETDAGAEALPEAVHARRALALIAASVVVIAITGILYLHPSLALARGPARSGPAAQAYQIAALDFPTPAQGWFVATFSSGRFAVLHTTDAGDHWTRQLAGATGGRTVYMNFFDASHGVFALLGVRPQLYGTADGGRTWTSQAAFQAAVVAISVSFADPDDGWLLADPGNPARPGTELYVTRNGGATWQSLGSPVAETEQALRVQFLTPEEGWLDAVASKPYAFKTVDAGRTWRRVLLPAPQGGWPRSGEFFVGARPTQGAGVVATVVHFAPTAGRSGIGGQIVSYPPLKVDVFDGGVPVVYSYATFADVVPAADLTAVGSEHRSGSSSSVQAPDQVELGSLDGGLTWRLIGPPTQTGAIGFSDAQNWWWIGSGAWSTSSDGGTTWTPYRNIGVLQPLPGSLEVLDADHAWFAAMAGPRPTLEATDDAGLHWRMVFLPPVSP